MLMPFPAHPPRAAMTPISTSPTPSLPAKRHHGRQPHPWSPPRPERNQPRGCRRCRQANRPSDQALKIALPVIAAMVMGQLSKQAKGGPAKSGGRALGLDELIGMPGGAAEGAATSKSNQGGMLGANKDGSAVDEIFNMVLKSRQLARLLCSHHPGILAACGAQDHRAAAARDGLIAVMIARAPEGCIASGREYKVEFPRAFGIRSESSHRWAQ